MKKTLNITNGDSAVRLMEEAGVAGEILAWRDVLHDGPVPQATTRAELSEVRATFIAECGWGEYQSVLDGFRKRDEVLERINSYDRIVLWFEHDLYDQLQLLQILNWLGECNNAQVPVSLICTDQYLGTLSPDAIQSLYTFEQPVTAKQLELAVCGWSAFTDRTPLMWRNLLDRDTAALVFLHGAILRLLEEFPSAQNGLSRTQQQALSIIATGENCVGKIFSGNQLLEPRIFMGDTSFFMKLLSLTSTDSKRSLLRLEEAGKKRPTELAGQKMYLTELGAQVLEGRRNWLDLTHESWWIGGVHLTPENRWCWDSERTKVYRYQP